MISGVPKLTAIALPKLYETLMQDLKDQSIRAPADEYDWALHPGKISLKKPFWLNAMLTSAQAVLRYLSSPSKHFLYHNSTWLHLVSSNPFYRTVCSS